MKINLVSYENFSQQEKGWLDQVIGLLADVFNDPRMMHLVLSFVWDGKQQFADNLGKSNQEIWDTIQKGSELLSPAPNGAMDLQLSIYHHHFWQRNDVIGYGTPDDPVIHLEGSWFDSMTNADCAGNLAHEWMHKLGFDHDFQATEKRPFSVPYAVGDMVANLAAQIEQEKGISDV